MFDMKQEKPIKFGVSSEEFRLLYEEKKKFITLPLETEHYTGALPEKTIVEVIDLKNDKRRRMFKVTHQEQFEDVILASLFPMTSAASYSESNDQPKRTGGRVSTI